MTLEQLQSEQNSIFAESLRIPARRRLKWIKLEIRKRLPPQCHELVLQSISTTEALLEDQMNVKAAKTQFAVSIGCIALAVILAFGFSNPTGIQYWIIRGLFAVGLSAVAVRVLMGTVKVNWSVARSLVVTATGGFALLILVFYINPPAPPSPNVPLSKDLGETNSTPLQVVAPNISPTF